MELVRPRDLERQAVRVKRHMPQAVCARDRIIIAATDVLKSHNFQELSVDSIAKLAHVTRRTLYNHFENKQELYRFVRMEALRRLMIGRAIDIPEQMPLEDGVRFFARHAQEIVGDPDNIEILQAIARDGASQPWLRSDYQKLVREPLVLTLENYLLRRLRRGSAASRVCKDVCEQFVLTIECMFVHPLVTSGEPSEVRGSQEGSLDIVANAFSSLITSAAERTAAAA